MHLNAKLYFYLQDVCIVINSPNYNRNRNQEKNDFYSLNSGNYDACILCNFHWYIKSNNKNIRLQLLTHLKVI